MKALRLIALLTLTGLMSVSGQVQDRFTALKESYQREIQRVKEPLDRKYVEALKRLQQSYTTEGKLDEALAVRKEIEAFSKGESSPSAIASAPDMGPSEGQEKEWSGDNRRGVEGDNRIVVVDAKSSLAQKLFRSEKVSEFPSGMWLKLRYKTSDYAGEGIQIRAYHNANDYLYRSITLLPDNEWHEYDWPYKAEFFRGASEIRFEIHLLAGSGTVKLDGLTMEVIQ